jgi:4-oxalomesaconate tautomerase
VSVTEREVDFGPTCGNILVGVGPAAIEKGLFPAEETETRLRIRAVNTGALVEAVIQTPGGQVRYGGETAIDGVPGTAAPVALNFLDVVGSRTSGMFPTGNKIDVIDGVEVSCVDVAMPMMIARAVDLGVTGYETLAELDDNTALFARLKAGALMGLGDVTKSVVPKLGLIAPPQGDGHFCARYFMPWDTHPTLAVTGSQCLATCAVAPGTVADGVVRPMADSGVMKIEHPMGLMEVVLNFARDGDDITFQSAGVTRTARLIARGEVLVPAAVMER